MQIDLTGADVVDAHCHPFRAQDLLDRDPRTFETRCMFLGTALLSSKHANLEAAAFVEEMTETTMFGLALRRWIARHLGCEPTKDAVVAARDLALRADPPGYVRGLLEAENVVALVADEGYPQPTITREEFETAVGGVPVHRVGRIEPWIVQSREEGSFDAAAQRFEAIANEAADDPRLIGFKTIIAYRTGLDVTDPSTSEASDAFDRWRADGWTESREHAKPVRDFLLRRAFAIAKERDRVFHVHVGAGDPDVNLTHAKPQDAFAFFVEHQEQPILMIHSGWPWVAEATYVGTVLPNVYMDLSELVPWGWGQIDHSLEMILGSVPAAKVVHGCDESSEPEMFPVSARLVRQALERVLGSFVDRDYLSPADAEALGRGVLAENVRRLHGI
ncbi:MAG TPA: amidohydrolase family protein [Actinomycetota bacterium]|nr:amidohydrolase family protein [Actinomycetota bacterium]